MVTLSAINVYPVKSCRGIALPAARVTATGLEFDREWMLVRPDNAFVTQRELPRLALVETGLTRDSLQLAAPGMPPISIALAPSGERAQRQVRVWRDTVEALDEGEQAARWFSEYTGTPLRLVRFAREGRRPSNREFTREYEGLSKFADGYALLIISSASLADLNRRLAANGAAPLPMNRFRPNLVIEGDDVGPYDEDRLTWLRHGSIALKPVKPCTRCPIPTTDQMTAQVGVEPLLTLASYRLNQALGGPTFGNNAIVVAGAGQSLTVGAELEIEWNF